MSFKLIGIDYLVYRKASLFSLFHILLIFLSFYCLETTDVCALEYAHGDCDDWSLYWYYNSDAGRCAQFYYGGCGGNGNRFQSREECMGFCGPTTPRPTTTTTRRPTTVSVETTAMVTSGVPETVKPGEDSMPPHFFKYLLIVIGGRVL